MNCTPATADRRNVRRNLGCVASALVLGICLASSGAFAQQTNNAQPPPAVTEKPVKPSREVLSVGDDSIDPNQPIKPGFLVNVSVVGEADASGDYPVDEAGNITLRYSGVSSAIPIKNLTPALAQDAIAQYLKQYLKRPVVKVTIKSVPRPVIFIAGAVTNVGQIIIGKETALLDVIATAGYTENADLSKVRLIRKETVDGKEKLVEIFINFERYLKAKTVEDADESLNPLLKDKDRIIVSSRVLPGVGSISVLGEVLHPTDKIVLRSGSRMSVREAINLTGGLLVGADKKRVYVRRAGEDRPYILDIQKAEQGDVANNIDLMPDDAVYVEKLDANNFLIMNGGFIRPTKLPYEHPISLMQAIAEVGNVTPFAKIKDPYIARHPNNTAKGTKIIRFNLEKIVKGTEPDLDLQPGDEVFIAPGLQPKPGIGIVEGIQLATSLGYLYNIFRGGRVNGF